MPIVTPYFCAFSFLNICSISSLADNPILFFLSLWGHSLKFHYYLFHSILRRGEWVIYFTLFNFHSKAIRWFRSRMFCKPVLQPHSCIPYRPTVQSPSELGSSTWILCWLILPGLFSGSFSLLLFEVLKNILNFT